MAGLKKSGADANALPGSKFKDTEGGFDAGNGRRTYTKPSYTLFVAGIPDAESSDSVERVFEGDAGFLQCRPVGHKHSRRMVFVDYDCIEHATRGLMAHQGHQWEDMDEGLKIDYDKDARSKRNTALDQDRFEKFWPIGPRREKVETDNELFARLKAEAADAKRSVLSSAPTVSKVQAKRKAAVAAQLQIKGAKAAASDGKRQQEDEKEVAEGPSKKAKKDTSATGQSNVGSLVGYGSGSDDSAEQEEQDDEEDEIEQEEEEEESEEEDEA